MVTDEVAARGVRGTRGVVANRFSLGSGQPKPRAGRRKHIADGPKGAASMGASKAKAAPSGCVWQRGSCKWEGPSSRMTQTSAAKRREGVDEVAARGVLGTRGVAANRFSLGSGRRLTLQAVACGKGDRANGRVHRPA